MHWRSFLAWRRGDVHAEEFAEHVRLLTQEYIGHGLAPQEAERQARIRFGNVALKREEIRDMDRLSGLRSAGADIRYALRRLRRSPAFTLAAAATLAIGIGANTAVFSVVHEVLLKPLPYEHPEQLVSVSYRSRDPKRFLDTVPSPVFAAWTAQNRGFADLSAYSVGTTTFVTKDGEPVRLPAAFISSNFFVTLGTQPIERGRVFGPVDDESSAPAVVIVSRRFADQRLAGDGDPLGHAIRLNGTSYSIVGIIANSFRFPDSVTPDIYLPIDLRVGSQVVMSTNVLGRLKSTWSVDQASRDLDALSHRAAGAYPSAMQPVMAADPATSVVGLQRRIAGDLRGLLWLALGAAGCVLLIACANVTGLLVARMTSRDRELAMRTALGATPRRLGQWLLAETLVLTMLGAALGLVVLDGTLAGFRNLLAKSVPHAEAIAIDSSVLMFTAAILWLTSVSCATIPIVRMRRKYPAHSIRLSSSGAIRTPVPDGVRGGLVCGQVAVAVMLLIASLLLLNTLWRLSTTTLGFNASHLLTLKVSATGFGDSDTHVSRLAEILNRLRRLPDVTAVGASTVLPLEGHDFRFTIPIEGEPPPPVLLQDAIGVDVVSPGYFPALGATILSGRDFDVRDSSTSRPVAIVNSTFVRQNLKGRDPLERRVSLGGTPRDAHIAIVGVVDDLKDRTLGTAPEPVVYRPLSQAAPQIGWSRLALAIRTTSDASSLFEAAQQQVAAVVPTSAVYDLVSMESRIANTVAPQRLRVTIFGIFAAVAVVLAVVGVYGLLASAVAQSTHELGVRLSLGASPRQLIALVLRRAAVPTAIGILIGFAGSAICSRVLSGWLYGVRAIDTTMYLTAALIMVGASLLAAGLPAYRASKIDPIEVLRMN